MLKFFKNQQPITLILLVIILLMTRVPFLFVQNFKYSNTYLNIEIYPTSISLLLGMILIFVQAVWLNSIFSNSHLLTEKSVIPALVWILITGINPSFMVIGFPLISATIILRMMQIIFNHHSNTIPIQQCFQLGILLGILILMQPVFILTIPFFLVLIYNMNTHGIREYLIFLISIALTFLWAWSFVYLTDQSLHWIERFKNHFGIAFFPMNWIEGAKWIVISCYVLGGFGGLFALMSSASAKRKKNVRSLIILVIALGISCLLSNHWDISNLLIWLTPASILITISLLIIHKIKYAELVFGIFVFTTLSSVVYLLIQSY